MAIFFLSFCLTFSATCLLYSSCCSVGGWLIISRPFIVVLDPQRARLGREQHAHTRASATCWFKKQRAVSRKSPKKLLTPGYSLQQQQRGSIPIAPSVVSLLLYYILLCEGHEEEYHTYIHIPCRGREGEGGLLTDCCCLSAPLHKK